MAITVSEKEAGDVVEAAQETEWRLPSWIARKGFGSPDELRGMLLVPTGADQAPCERTGYVTATRAANAGAYNPW
jgi:hypothetical protein